MVASMCFSISPRHVVTFCMVLLTLSGCASEATRVQETEQMLAAAGFRAKPADTPQRQAMLAHLPPHRLMMQPRKHGSAGSVGYVYGDPDVCHCVFVGGPDDFSRFQQLAFQQRLADQYMAAAQMQQQAYDWSLWGPGFWGPGPGPVFIAHDHDHDHDMHH
jgi:hypothetical protein